MNVSDTQLGIDNPLQVASLEYRIELLASLLIEIISEELWTEE